MGRHTVKAVRQAQARAPHPGILVAVLSVAGIGVDSVSAQRDDWLDRSAYLLMSPIEGDGAMSIGELADAFALEPSTVNRQTSAMLRNDLVDRVEDPEDRRNRRFLRHRHGAAR